MNFEDMIRDALNKGLTTDEIAKDINKALNAVEQERNNGIKRARLLEDMDKQLNDLWDGGIYSYDMAALMATLTAARKNPDWDVETINDFCEVARDGFANTEKLLSGKAAEVLGDWLDGMFSEIFSNKSKETEKDTRKPAPAGKPKFETDKEKVARFLNSL